MNWLYPIWLPVAGLLLVLWLFMRGAYPEDDWRRVIAPDVLDWLRGSNNPKARRYTALLGASVAALALSSPSVRVESDSLGSTRAWFILIDLSRSSTIDDLAPSRLSVMRDTALDIVEAASGQPVSLIGYAGDAFELVPLTLDKQLVADRINLLEHGLIPIEGSDPGRALTLASNIIDRNRLPDSRILLLGDTGGITGSSARLATLLADRGHRLDLLVFGLDEGRSSVEVDLDAAAALAAAGRGTVLHQKNHLPISLASLKLDPPLHRQSTLLETGIAIEQWNNRSHWILVWLLPILLYLQWRRH